MVRGSAASERRMATYVGLTQQAPGQKTMKMLGKGNLNVIDEVFAAQLLHWNELWTVTAASNAQVKAIVTEYRSALPDLTESR